MEGEVAVEVAVNWLWSASWLTWAIDGQMATLPWPLSCNTLCAAGVRLAVPWMLSCNTLCVAGV